MAQCPKSKQNPLSPTRSHLQSGNCFFQGHGAFDFSLTLVLGFPIRGSEVDPIWEQRMPQLEILVGGGWGGWQREQE